MRIVNRVAISVVPKEPFMAWMRAIAGNAPEADASADEFATIYLVDERDVFDPQKLLRKHYAMIFEEQLDSWHRDETAWPSRRTFAMFCKWFDATVAEMVWDLGKQPLEAE